MSTSVIIQPDPATETIVIESEQETIEIITDGETTSVVIDTGETGPIGPAGPAGDGSKITKIASTAIGGHRVVMASGANSAAIADKDTISHMHLVLGLTDGAVMAGNPATIVARGELVEPSWSFSVGPVYLDNNGLMTQTAPTSGFILKIGTAIAPTVLMIDIGAPISIS
jgi:hypothetical protein